MHSVKDDQLLAYSHDLEHIRNKINNKTRMINRFIISLDCYSFDTIL